MNRELKYLRYGLIILPAIITTFLYDYADYDRFTLHFLMLLLLATIQAPLPRTLSLVASALELLFTAWLCHTYGTLMIFPAISALLHYSRLPSKAVPAMFTCIHLVVLNTALSPSSPADIGIINFTFLLAAVLNELLLRTGRGREETLFLYDELRRKHFELEETRSRLLQFTSQVENAAQSEERVRISRQLHDDIGHRLIRVKLMVEAAIHTLPASPATGMDMMGQIRDQLSASMDDMRAAVRRINYTPQLEGAYALDRLLEETGRDTGIATAYHFHGQPYPLYPSIQVVLYRNAQEAITNALRHGKATAVWIEVTYTEHELVMKVGNNGVLPVGEQLGRLQSCGGMGLKGMNERVSLIGGSLELQPEPQFTVVTRLPMYRQREIM